MWSQMQVSELRQAIELSKFVHVAYPEDPQIFFERFLLYPAGCFTFNTGEQPSGYILSHPWKTDQAPRLNTLLGEIPSCARSYYLHDIALSSCLQKKGHGASGIDIVKAHARNSGFAEISLIAIDGSIKFWRANGFIERHVPTLSDNLASYDAAATFMTSSI